MQRPSLFELEPDALLAILSLLKTKDFSGIPFKTLFINEIKEAIAQKAHVITEYTKSAPKQIKAYEVYYHVSSPTREKLKQRIIKSHNLEHPMADLTGFRFSIDKGTLLSIQGVFGNNKSTRKNYYTIV